MRFAARLARIGRRLALLPPKDPLGRLDDAAMARAASIADRLVPPAEPTARDLAVRGAGWRPDPKPAVEAAERAWFDREIRPFLAAYAAFCERVQAWEARLGPPQRGIPRIYALACISPAFAGCRPPRIRLPPGAVEALAAAPAAPA